MTHSSSCQRTGRKIDDKIRHRRRTTSATLSLLDSHLSFIYLGHPTELHFVTPVLLPDPRHTFLRVFFSGMMLYRCLLRGTLVPRVSRYPFTFHLFCTLASLSLFIFLASLVTPSLALLCSGVHLLFRGAESSVGGIIRAQNFRYFSLALSLEKHIEIGEDLFFP